MTTSSVPSDPAGRKVARAQLVALYEQRGRWEDLWTGSLTWCIGAGCLGGILEAVRWMQTGQWTPLDTWPLGRVVIDRLWLDAPTSWLGLHKIVVGFLEWPLFVTAPLLASALLGIVYAMIDDHCEKKIATFQEQHNINDSYSDLLDRRFEDGA